MDAFVFKDELKYWCNLGYDYIGAPWFDRYHESTMDSPIIGVGNGGFSLRRVTKFYLGSKIAHLLRPDLKKLNVQEDMYWVNHIAPYFPGFKVAPIDIALKFAFENHPKRCLELNQNKLPFGVHAWHKYDLDFWRPFIEAEGYEI